MSFTYPIRSRVSSARVAVSRLSGPSAATIWIRARTMLTSKSSSARRSRRRTVVPCGPRMRVTASCRDMPFVATPSTTTIRSPARRPAFDAGVLLIGCTTSG